ncbi:hypothetical protein ACFQHW_09625 [Lapidilactobacillus achengensis]|uniref:Uncharacterized protein n=1 Tax=Lapidilactobacillus achengensis TaxID=2486000 RepID=A0ABW1UPE9_9LACO|nr:hypothetical protein [Lapidilactobacillus achengensis]
MKKATNKFTQAGTILLAISLAAGAVVVVPELGAGSQIETVQAAVLPLYKNTTKEEARVIFEDATKTSDRVAALINRVNARYTKNQVSEWDFAPYSTQEEALMLSFFRSSGSSKGKWEEFNGDNSQITIYTCQSSLSSYILLILPEYHQQIPKLQEIARGVLKANPAAATTDAGLRLQAAVDLANTEGDKYKAALGVSTMSWGYPKGVLDHYDFQTDLITALLDDLDEFDNAAPETTTITINYQAPDGLTNRYTGNS